jgi:hypothetical protein
MLVMRYRVLYITYYCFLTGLKLDLLRTISFQAPFNQTLYSFFQEEKAKERKRAKKKEKKSKHRQLIKSKEQKVKKLNGKVYHNFCIAAEKGLDNFLIFPANSERCCSMRITWTSCNLCVRKYQTACLEIPKVKKVRTCNEWGLALSWCEFLGQKHYRYLSCIERLSFKGRGLYYMGGSLYFSIIRTKANLAHFFRQMPMSQK